MMMLELQLDSCVVVSAASALVTVGSIGVLSLPLAWAPASSPPLSDHFRPRQWAKRTSTTNLTLVRSVLSRRAHLVVVAKTQICLSRVSCYCG